MALHTKIVNNIFGGALKYVDFLRTRGFFGGFQIKIIITSNIIGNVEFKLIIMFTY